MLIHLLVISECHIPAVKGPCYLHLNFSAKQKIFLKQCLIVFNFEEYQERTKMQNFFFGENHRGTYERYFQ